jgi:N-acetylmuramic acid 6-phosphate etherase
MIRLGKVYKNLMVDMNPVNQKLLLRSRRIIREIAGCSEECASEALEAAGRKTKTAVVMALLNVGRERAETLLAEAGGHIGDIPGVPDRGAE